MTLDVTLGCSGWPWDVPRADLALPLSQQHAHGPVQQGHPKAPAPWARPGRSRAVTRPPPLVGHSLQAWGGHQVRGAPTGMGSTHSPTEIRVSTQRDWGQHPEPHRDSLGTPSLCWEGGIGGCGIWDWEAWDWGGICGTGLYGVGIWGCGFCGAGNGMLFGAVGSVGLVFGAVGSMGCCLGTCGFLTQRLQHAALAGQRFGGRAVLEALQGHHAQPRSPDRQDAPHLGATLGTATLSPRALSTRDSPRAPGTAPNLWGQ